MRSRKLLAFILCLITGPALAGYMTLLGAGLGAIQPVAQATFTNSSYSTNLSNLTSVATFSRAGNAMQFNSSGYLTYGPNNLLLNTATLGTQTVTVQVGVNYILSIKGTGSVTLTGASTAGPLNGTGASNRVDLKITAATTSLTLTVSGSVTSARLSAVTYETAFRTCDDVDNTAAAYYGPRFDYTYNGSSWVPAGLLVEGAATNLAPQSQNFSSGYSANNSTRTIDATLASDGSTPSAKYTAPAGAGSPSWFNTSVLGSVASGSNYAISLEIDGSSGAYPYLSFQNNTSTNYAVAVFNTTSAANGVATQTVTSGATIVSTAQTYLGNGRYRISMVASIAAIGTGAYIQPGLAKATTGNTVTNGIITATYAGTEYLYASFLQLEAGSSASSYTPTAASAVTRAAETVQLTGPALSTLQGTSGTAIVQTTDIAPNSTISQTLLGLANGTTMGYPLFYWPSNSKISTVNATTTLSAAVTPTVTSPIRAGIAWSASGRSIGYNGGAIATDANAFSSAAVTGAYLGVGNGGSLYWLNGHIASAGFYSSRLPDATLQAKSVVGASY